MLVLITDGRGKVSCEYLQKFFMLKVPFVLAFVTDIRAKTNISISLKKKLT